MTTNCIVDPVIPLAVTKSEVRGMYSWKHTSCRIIEVYSTSRSIVDLVLMGGHVDHNPQPDRM